MRNENRTPLRMIFNKNFQGASFAPIKVSHGP